MLSIATARALREAGLTWKPAELDFFAIPDRGLDERTFVINDLPASTADLLGEAIITFDGAVEWALDYVPSGEVLWLPTEAQLRERLAAELAGEPDYGLRLTSTGGSHRCETRFRGQPLTAEADDAADAYGAVLLFVLRAAE
ncbi:MAG: pilus assembly protein CpaE [Anaerolineales bacterium]